MRCIPNMALYSQKPFLAPRVVNTCPFVSFYQGHTLHPRFVQNMNSAYCLQFLQKSSRGSECVTHLDSCTFLESQVLVTLGYYLKLSDAWEVCFLCSNTNHIGFAGKGPTQKCASGLLQVLDKIQTTSRNRDWLLSVETSPHSHPLVFGEMKESEEELNDVFQLWQCPCQSWKSNDSLLEIRRQSTCYCSSPCGLAWVMGVKRVAMMNLFFTISGACARSLFCLLSICNWASLLYLLELKKKK